MSDEPRRVFCKDCRHHRQYMFSDMCAAPDGTPLDPVNGEAQHVACRTRNKNLDCALFEGLTTEEKEQHRRLYERFVEAPKPKAPWWRFRE